MRRALHWGFLEALANAHSKAPAGIVRSSFEGNGGEPLPLLLLALRSLYVYLHIDAELLKNGQFEPPDPSIGQENCLSFACHSRVATLADGTSGERVSEVFE